MVLSVFAVLCALKITAIARFWGWWLTAVYVRFFLQFLNSSSFFEELYNVTVSLAFWGLYSRDSISSPRYKYISIMAKVNNVRVSTKIVSTQMNFNYYLPSIDENLGLLYNCSWTTISWLKIMAERNFVFMAVSILLTLTGPTQECCHSH